jgi:predicted ATPase/DNA-binding SARP family transcriptional activator
VEFRLLGPLEVIGDDGLPVALGGLRPRALLAQLLLQPNQPVSNDRLIDGIWGESPPASAQNALQVHVHALRSALGADRIVTRPPGYLVRVELDELDVDRFERLAAARADDLRAALALWRGPALADLAYEPFAQAAAARLDESRLAVLEARIDLDLAAGRHATLVGELDALVASHPHRERLQSQRIVALYRSGRQADALGAYRAARDALDELGLEPSPELRALERRILEHDPSLAATPTSSGQTPAGPGADLIGRDLELAAVTGLLRREDTRLVTLTGPGGTGKTSLALAASASLGGAPFVDLAPVADASLVIPTIAARLGIDEEQGTEPIATVAGALEGRGRVFAVVDNLEHLPGSFADIAALLDAAPQLQLLATSRGPLHIALEHEYRVPPLGVPDASAADRDSVSAAAAVRLYVERAREVVPEFDVTEANAEAIAGITRALDGLPLAIELAAARMRVLGVEGTRRRLGEALALLTRTAPDLPERQRSIRATVAWSVELLDPDARHVLAALSVFPAGATLEALEAVVDQGSDVAAALEALLDASLASSSLAVSEPRFTMLETIRAYASTELARDERGDELRRRQLEWAITLASDDGEPRYWTRGTDWLDRVEPELPNVRAALEVARAHGDATSELRLASSMRHYWRVRGHGIEGRRRLEEALTRIPEVAPQLGARVQHEAAVMRLVAGDWDGARALWLSALETYEELGIDIEVGRVHAELGALANATGDPEAAIGFCEAAARMLEGEEFIHLIVLGNLAEAYERSGDLDRARTTAQSVLEAQRANGDRDGVAYMSLALASIAVADGDLAESHRRLIECLTVAAEVGFVELTAYALGLAAELATALDELEVAAMLIGASRERFGQLGVTPHVPEAERQARVAASLEELLPGADDAMTRGRALRHDEAVALALGLDARGQ